MTDQIYSDVLRSIISELCRIPTSTIEDSSDLFELGFDSILAIQMVARIRKELEVDISPRDLFVSPCVSELTEVIRVKKAHAK